MGVDGKLQAKCGNFRVSDNYAIFVIFGAYYFSILQLTVLAPILPGILEEIQRNDGYRFGMRNQNFAISDDIVFRKSWWAGVILSSGGIAEMITIPLGVRFTRKYGHQNALYLSSLFEVCGCAILAFAVNYTMLFVGRIIQCIGVMLLDIAGSAMLAGRFDDDTRPRAFATAFNGIPLGYVTSALVGTLAYEYFGYTITLLSIGVFGTIEALLRFCMIETGKSHEEKNDLTEIGAYKSLVTNSVPLVCLYFTFLMFLTLYVMDSTAPDDIVSTRRGHFWQVGVIIAISTTLQILTQHIVGFLGVKYGFKKFMFMGLLSISLGMVVYAWLPGVWLTAITFVLQKIGYGFLWPAVGCLLSEFVETSGQTTYEHVFGLQSLVKVFGISAGAFTGGLLPTSQITYWVVGALCLVSTFSVCFIIRSPSCHKRTSYCEVE